MWLLLEIAAPIVAAFAGFVLAAALSAGATEDAYRAGYLAGIRAVASLGQLLPDPGAARPPQEPGA
jgi:predicted hotdog family 3-hydroxylacyl-ACP dehydratase